MSTYNSNYYRKNKDKYVKALKRWAKNHPKKYRMINRLQARKYRKSHPEVVRAIQRRYYLKHRHIILRAYRRSRG